MPSELPSVLDFLERGLSRLKVLVLGDLMLDRYVIGDVDRISPEAPVPVLRHVQRYERPGGAANVAMNLAGLGCQPFLAGFWGSDGEQAELKNLLSTAGIETGHIVTSSLPTISKTRILARTQQMLRLDIESRENFSEEELEELEARALELVPKMDAVILSDYAKGALTSKLCAAVIHAARQANIPVLVDPKSKDLTKYAGATTICPNLSELSLVTGIPAHQTQALLAAAHEQIMSHHFDFLTVTMSEKGITILYPDAAKDYYSPARAREVFDVSGAGDTVIATLAASLAGGLHIHSAVDLANMAAGIVIGKIGTVPIAQHELIAALTPSFGITLGEKILNLDRMLLRVAEWRAGGETVVFTNGCFDLLHVGHIALLEDCRRFGSKLVLGLNSDASVSRLKGPTRPIVGERERARVMAALASVDAVVLFPEDTPLNLIQALKPDVLVKGGDYQVETVVGSRRGDAARRTRGDCSHNRRILYDKHREEVDRIAAARVITDTAMAWFRKRFYPNL